LDFDKNWILFMKLNHFLSIFVSFVVSLSVIHANAANRINCSHLENYSFETVNAEELASDRQLWKIYKGSFPKNERVDRKILIRNLAKNPSHMIIRLVENSNTVGLAILNLFENVSISFLGYLAIDPEKRGQSLGSELFNCAAFETKRRLTEKGVEFKGMVWEVEIPDLADNPKDKIIRESRISFYNKLGATLLTDDYVMSSVSSEHEDLKMYLMILGVEESLSHQTQSERLDFITQVKQAAWDLAATEKVD
jgi:GNAT superfamily N-acetyltransferase